MFIVKEGERMSNKNLRLAKLFGNRDNNICIVPIDHGMTYGPITGIKNYLQTVNQVVEGGADAIVLHKGLLNKVINTPELVNSNYIMHLSGSTVLGKSPEEKVIVSSVESAIKLGAVGVSVQINFGCDSENRMLKDIGIISDACYEWGMPLLTMVYVVGGGNNIAHAARVAEELGSDIVKVECSRDSEELKNIISSINIPVIIAGGAGDSSQEDLLRGINDILGIGVSGVAMGRNIFQYSNPRLLTRLISALVHKKMNLEECLNCISV